MTPLEVLKMSDFGKRTAEEEQEQLRAYFVETEQWSKVFEGDVDIVYGPKGSGKSAIYSLISQNSDKLFDRNIIVVPGENPQGAPAFRDIRENPPKSEFEFTNIWKLYTLALVGQAMKEWSLDNPKCREVIGELEYADLIPAKFSLARLLKFVLDYVRPFTQAEALEGGVDIDGTTGMPTGVKGRIVFREPGSNAVRNGIKSIDELYETAAQALSEANLTIWIVLDRLDVAFADKTDLEAEALRALFNYYKDTKNHKSIRAKIFLRSDIWNDLVRDGFREASHIERSLNISWSNEDLTNLVVRRALANDAICKYYDINKIDILADYASQEAFLNRMFPDQVESGANKPKTALQWALGRTRDALDEAAPRELIHFLNELRNAQINRLERGEKTLPDGQLFESASFKEALPRVSKVRLEQTIYAEFSDLKAFIERLREQKATQPLSNLMSLWGVNQEEALSIASRLEEIGFFQRSGAFPDVSWRIPFLYRPALDLVQGSADKI